MMKCFCLIAASALLFGCPGTKPVVENDSGAVTAGSADKVILRGSNTIGEELAPHLIAEFKKAHPKVTFDLETKATGYGMAALRIGQCDIAAASRAAIAEERELAKEANLEMNDYVLGAYSVTIVANANNPVANLTTEQVHDIFTGKLQNWKDVGGPDAAIHLYIRDPISGTYLGFKEVAMKNEDYAAHPKLLKSYQAIVEAVAADPNGIGYSGILAKPAAGIKQLTIGGVEPSAATVHSGKYPYARMLRFYTNKALESEPTKNFISFALSTRGQEILTEMGFTPKP
ncbi:MAG: phosphate ABC transporter substrate-binding protein [Verrucomicrobiota bacterium]